jgi:hypothetical protein
MSDFGARREKCEPINTITLEKGELKKTGVMGEQALISCNFMSRYDTRNYI